MEKMCGNCKHSFIEADGELVCTNTEAEDYGIWVGIEDFCEDWEEA